MSEQFVKMKIDELMKDCEPEATEFIHMVLKKATEAGFPEPKMLMVLIGYDIVDDFLYLQIGSVDRPPGGLKNKNDMERFIKA